MSPASRRLIATLSLVFAACAERGQVERSVPRDSAGIAIVESHAPAWDSSTAWRVSEEPLLRLGEVFADSASRQGSGPASFTYVRGATRLSDGRVVVLEGSQNEIRWFGPDGAHLYTRGGRGGGPAEFNSATTLLRLPGDSILVQDAPRIVQKIFDPSGNFVRGDPLDGERYRQLGRWLECLTMTLPDRSLLGCQEEPGLPAGASDQPGRLRTFARYHLVPWDMSRSHPLGLYGGIEQWGVRRADGGVSYGVHPFHSRTSIAAGGTPLRVAIALNPEYSIELWSSDGVLERIVRRPDARPEASEEELELARMDIFGASDEAVRNRLLGEMEIPRSPPAVQDMRIGPAGDLWVKRDLSRIFGGPARYDVFDPAGVFLGSLTFPGEFRILEVGDDYLLGVRADELGVPFVEMYSLEK